MINGDQPERPGPEPDHVPALDQHRLRVQGRQPDARAPSTGAARAPSSTSRPARARTTCTARCSSSSATSRWTRATSSTPRASRSRPFKRHQFGANLGGPIVKNKTFFFVTLRGPAPAAAARLQQRRAERRPAGGGDRSRGAQPAAPHPAPPTRPAPPARPASSGTGTANVDIDQWTGDVNHQLGRRRPPPRATTRTSATSAASRTCRATPSPASATPARSQPPDRHPEPHAHLRAQPGERGALRLQPHQHHVRAQRAGQPGRLRDQQRDHDRGRAAPDHGAGRRPQLRRARRASPRAAPTPPSSSPTRSATSAAAHAFKFGGEYRSFHNINFETNGGTFTYPSLADFQAGRGQRVHGDAGRHRQRRHAEGLRPVRPGQLPGALQPHPGAGLPLRPQRLARPRPTTASCTSIPRASRSSRWARACRDKIYGNKNNYQPRVGVVWDPFGDGRTVGARRLRALERPAGDEPGDADGRQSPTGHAADLHRSGGSIRLDNALTVAQALRAWRPRRVDADFRNPLVQTWNVNVQRELWNNFSAMVGYFGSKGDHLRVSRNLNQFANGRRGPTPGSSADEPHPARHRARQHHRGHEPRLLALQRRSGSRSTSASPAGCQFNGVLHALGVEGHELPELAGRGGAGQHQHRGRLRALGLRRPPPLRA